MRIPKKIQKLMLCNACVILVVWFVSILESPPNFNEYEETNCRFVDKCTIRDENGKSVTPTEPNKIYILQWTKPDKEPYTFMKEGQDMFYEKRCPINNCYVTWNKTYLADLTRYDAILFYSHIVSKSLTPTPSKRSPEQYYVFVSSEPASHNPVYQKKYKHFFNLTWTYKLNSDVFYGYIQVENKNGDIIGPKEVMHWPKLEEMDPIDDELRDKLHSKKIAAAWFVSNCHARSGRFNVAMKIQKELAKYNMTVDIYGHCGTKTFPENITSWELLERDYYFYFSFENSINEDYVTEKLLNALQHYTVPIVLGGANYTRFMPDGIYLNARILTTEELVKQMVDLINDKEKYYNLFRWHNHYSYYYAGGAPETDYYCNFCKNINDLKLINYKRVYRHFDKWWNGLNTEFLKTNL
ncbi:unnamed protein product [Chrysodeixis includens]|uniref:Fucosyltransferase n=1 Tax=Chrysodeixis includens TaxID=689277 RepID=A0A9P0BLN6_CHRIL|nr:unnamed protein product [Chrysodeixis includens]